jgi:hypothetical protein
MFVCRLRNSHHGINVAYIQSIAYLNMIDDPMTNDNRHRMVELTHVLSKLLTCQCRPSCYNTSIRQALYWDATNRTFDY